jgi:hypothetical protein
MSIEYRANARLSAPHARALLDAVAKEAAVQVLERGEGELSLRWSGAPRQGAAEDVHLEIEAESVYLAVHVGTRKQRDDLVHRLGALLKEQGVAAAFEEL